MKKKMSWNPDQQLPCQTCRKLYKHAELIQSLAQQLIIELQVSAQLHTRPSFPPTASIEDDANATDYDKDCDDDDDDDDHDDDDVDEDIDDGPFHHTDDRSESTKIFCPHPKCKDKPPYTKKANLQRHYTNHVKCNKNCVFCGHRSLRIRNYVTHFENCKSRKSSHGLSEEKKKTAVTQKRILSRIAANELDKMCKAGGGIDSDSRNNSRKRKSDIAAQSFRVGSSEFPSASAEGNAMVLDGARNGDSPAKRRSSRQQLAVETNNGNGVQPLASPRYTPLYDLNTRGTITQTSPVTAIELNPNITPTVCVEEPKVISGADDQTYITSWKLQQPIQERSAMDASSAQIGNMQSISSNIGGLAVQPDVENSLVDQTFQVVNAGANLDTYCVQGRLAATPNGRNNMLQDINNVYDARVDIDLWAAPRISNALFAPNFVLDESTGQTRHYDILNPQVAEYLGIFDAAPRIFS